MTVRDLHEIGRGATGEAANALETILGNLDPTGSVNLLISMYRGDTDGTVLAAAGMALSKGKPVLIGENK